jgi:enediyne biosynthesis protein E3
MNILGKLRRSMLTPDISQTRVDVRGFEVTSAEARDRLESVGRYFLTGFGAAAEAPVATAAEGALEAVAKQYRGFAYEGAAMALAIRDGLPVGGRRHVEQFLTGVARHHVYMVYVGVGWAMARLPKFRWSTLYSADPLLRWLILDGYGFHQAYFRTEKYVHQRYRDETCPWPGDPHAPYARRVTDQGVGRATWFVCGADPERVANTFGRFEQDRRADLYSGAGLAATYAGGCGRQDLERFRDLAGPYRAQVAQGSVFAATARVRADLVMPHTEMATDVFCGMPPRETTKVADEALIELTDSAAEPAYEIWRRRISDTFATPEQM